VYARILAYIQGRFTVDTYVRRYIRVHVCYTHPYIPTLMHCSMLTTQIADFDRELLRTLLLTCVCPPVDPRKKQKNKSLVLQNL